MTLEVIEGNILDVTSGIICHQVNCEAVMGAGLALQIKKKWPRVYDEYVDYVENDDKYRQGDDPLGWFNVTFVSNTLAVANIFGQIGHDSTKRQTNYGAIAHAFNWFSEEYWNRQVYIPWQMGCGLAGGNWEVYSEIVEFYIPNAIVVKLPEGQNANN